MHEMQKEIDAAKGAQQLLSVFENASRVPALEKQVAELQRQLDEKRPMKWHTINSLMEMGFKRETARRIMHARGVKGPQWFIEEQQIEQALIDLERGSEPLDPATHKRLFDLNEQRYRERKTKKLALQQATTSER